MECYLTNEPCNVSMNPDYYDQKDDCPIKEYKDSSYYYKPGESKSGAVWRADHVCRYYGITRAEKIRNRKFMEG